MSLHNRQSLEPWVPDSIKYYEHQTEGVRRMARMRSVLLGDDMGLGKSIQTLTVFAVDVKRGQSETMLIVCPASLKINWEEEVAKFTSFPFVTLPGGQPKKRAQLIQDFAAMTGPKIMIINYEQIEPHLADLNRIHFDIAAFDEAHYLKNFKSKRTVAAQKLLSRRSLLLTGSPLLNHVNELWPLLDRISPGEWGTYYGFTRRYCVYGGFEDRQIVGVKNEKELTARLQSVMIRRLKSEVLDLPPVQYVQRMVGLHPRQRSLYNQVVGEMKLDVSASETVEIDNVLTKFLRLKQICGTTSSVTEDAADHSEKLDVATEDAVQIIGQGHRIVAFTQFRSVQAAYAARMAKAGHEVYLLNGDVPSDPDGRAPSDPAKKWSRQEVVRAWATSPKPGIIIAMFQVAGVGLNMTEARHGQFLDKQFVPALNQQAVDRMHRIGASEIESVQVIEYICKDTVEERVEKILGAKRAVFSKIVEKDAWTSRLMAEALEEEMKK